MATALRAALDESRASGIPHASARPSVAGVWALGRIEARRMLLHPSFLIGTAFGLLILRGAFGSGGTQMDLGENLAWVIGGILVGMLIGTVLTTNIAAMRPRRDDTQALFGALPAPPETRTVGIVAGLLLGPVTVSVLLTACAWWAFRSNENIGPDIDLFLAVQVPLTVAALGAIGIAVGRWVPSLLGGPVVIAAHIFTGVVWAVPWVLPTSTDVDRPRHLIYLAAAITTWIVLALARDRRTAPRFVIAASAFAIGVVAAIQQLPPGGW
jgi:hypothetical protein